MPLFSVQVREVLTHWLFIEAPDAEAIYDWPYTDRSDALADVCSTYGHAVTVEDRGVEAVAPVEALPVCNNGRPDYTFSPLEDGL